MPDLDQIKQGKQGALKPAQASHGPVEQSRRRPHGCRDDEPC
jgi:hypothetical protein